MEDIFESCQLCGNPIKDKLSHCPYCTGDQRNLFGVDWGWMYQTEFDIFQRKAYFLGIPTALLSLPIALSQYSTRKSDNQSNSPPPWISIWGAKGCGKTWLIYALLQAVNTLPDIGLSFSIKEGEALSPDDVIFSSETKTENLHLDNVFPIPSTEGHTEKVYHLLKKKHFINKRRGQREYEIKPGPNSHIHRIWLYDSKGGWHENGLVENPFGEEADEARKRISQSPYIIILVNRDKVDEVASGLADLIGRIRLDGRPKKVAICVNKVEGTEAFLENLNRPARLQNRKIFEECLGQTLRNEDQRTKLLDKFRAIEDLSFCDVKYFLISSCGCDIRGNPNLDSAAMRPADLGIDWKPINVFPVFSWFLEEIEKARINCQEDVFAQFERIPLLLMKMLEQWRIIYTDTKTRRLKEYIPYSKFWRRR